MVCADYQSHVDCEPFSYEDFFEDLEDTAADVGNCLLAQLFLWQFWFFLGITLVFKQTVVLTRWRQYYKRTHAERVRVRKRRLRDTLNDPVLALHMEEQLLRRSDIQGNRQKMLEAMDQIREMANTEEEGSDDGKGENATKGQEKIDAANAMLQWTIGVSILIFLLPQWFTDSQFTSYAGMGMDKMKNLQPVRTSVVHYYDHGRVVATTSSTSTGPLYVPPSKLVATTVYTRPEMPWEASSRGAATPVEISRPVRAEDTSMLRGVDTTVKRPDRRRLREVRTKYDYGDYCGKWGSKLCSFLFCLIHLLHSYKLVRDATRKPKRFTAPKEGGVVEGDLERPLLAVTVS